MKRYEYIRIVLDMGDLAELNRFSGNGWRVAGIIHLPDQMNTDSWVLLERELPNTAFDRIDENRALKEHQEKYGRYPEKDIPNP